MREERGGMVLVVCNRPIVGDIVTPALVLLGANKDHVGAVSLFFRHRLTYSGSVALSFAEPHSPLWLLLVHRFPMPIYILRGVKSAKTMYRVTSLRVMPFFFANSTAS